VGIVTCRQTHGSRADWQLQLHLLVADGGVLPDRTSPLVAGLWPSSVEGTGSKVALEKLIPCASLSLFPEGEAFRLGLVRTFQLWKTSGPEKFKRSFW